jgi:hypothetical protein
MSDPSLMDEILSATPADKERLNSWTSELQRTPYAFAIPGRSR